MGHHIEKALDETVFTILRKQGDYLRWLKAAPDRIAIEEHLALPGKFSVLARCAVCGQELPMHVDYEYSWEKFPDGRAAPNWRERMICGKCGVISRSRLVIHFIKSLPAETLRTIYMPESISATARWVRHNYPETIFSEYFGPAHKCGEIIKNIRHEDLHRLSFADGLFSCVICLDVLEHVYNPWLCINEIYRVLKPGGVFLAMTPCDPNRTFNRLRAVLDPKGAIKHIEKPVYHCNPFAPDEGSLVYTDFGWEFEDMLSEVFEGNSFAAVAWSREYGYLGNNNIIFCGIKNIRY